MRVIMDELDNVFMSYEKILRRLKLIGIKSNLTNISFGVVRADQIICRISII